MPDATRLTAPSLLALQQLVGNRAVARVVGRANGGARIARAPAPPAPPHERVVGTRALWTRQRAIAVIKVVGHASPRWRGAKSSKKADENNEQLAAKRTEVVQLAIELALARLLPDYQITFVHESRVVVDPMTEPSDVTVESEGRGSRETLVEAGRRGRRANDPAMRRVEVSVSVHRAAETDVKEDVLRTESKYAATRDWGLWVGGEAGAEAIGKAGGILIVLKNRKTNEEATYLGWYGGFGLSVGVEVAKTSIPDFESFTTPEPMVFQDFDYANFEIGSLGIAVGFGLEYQKFYFKRFLGGTPVPRSGIQVGGLSLGGIGINLGSRVKGAMILQGDPSRWHQERTRLQRITSRGQSLPTAATGHRALFETGVATMSEDEIKLLDEYLHQTTEPLRKNTALRPGTTP